MNLSRDGETKSKRGEEKLVGVRRERPSVGVNRRGSVTKKEIRGSKQPSSTVTKERGLGKHRFIKKIDCLIFQNIYLNT